MGRMTKEQSDELCQKIVTRLQMELDQPELAFDFGMVDPNAGFVHVSMELKGFSVTVQIRDTGEMSFLINEPRGTDELSSREAILQSLSQDLFGFGIVAGETRNVFDANQFFLLMETAATVGVFPNKRGLN